MIDVPAGAATPPAQTELAQTLKSRHVAMISFGGIIGAGLFVGSASAFSKGGPGVILIYGVIGLLIFFIMRMLGEMAVAKPGLGSFVEYSAHALDHWAGFATGWLYWYAWVFTVGAETVAGARLLQSAGLDASMWAISVGLVTVLAIINLCSVKAYGEFEFWFAMVKVSAIAVFIVIGATFVGILHPRVALTTALGHGGFLPMGVAGLFAAVPVVLFSIMGSEVATIAAAESANPAANVARAARTVALRILLFYVLSIAVIVAILPWNSIAIGVSPFKSALDAIGVPGSSKVMSIIIITAVLSCVNSGIYITSRMLHELATRGDAPRSLAGTAINKVPRAGILISCLAGILAALAQLYLRKDIFTLLVSTSGSVQLFVLLIVAVAQIRERRRLEKQRMQLKFKVWLFAWLSYAVLAGMVGVFVVLAFIPAAQTELVMSGLAVCVVIFAAVLRQRHLRVVAAAR
ncbi:MAG: amino acid permease [Steroidobacteraceae bacterium]